MGFSKRLGPFLVSFADFELARPDTLEKAAGLLSTDFSASFEPDPHAASSSTAPPKGRVIHVENFLTQRAPPPIRIFYPVQIKPSRLTTPAGWLARRWMPHSNYVYGIFKAGLQPSNAVMRWIIWALANVIYVVSLPFTQLEASVNLLPLGRGGGLDPEGKMPVIVFSHGLLGFRGAYSAMATDLASHGYVVVCIEHLDGSAGMAHYTGVDGKPKWLPYNENGPKIRAQQLHQRVEEIAAVLDLLAGLDRGIFAESANVVRGPARLVPGWLMERLDMGRVVLAGHSFGGATVVAAAGVETRAKAAVGLDIWFDPVEEADMARVAGGLPMIAIDTEGFAMLRTVAQGRGKFFSLREAASKQAGPFVTERFQIPRSKHNDMSDLPLALWIFMWMAGRTGTLGARKVKDVMDRAVLEFLGTNLMGPDSAECYKVEHNDDDDQYLNAVSSS